MLENWIEINSVDAAKMGIGNDDIVEVTTPVGTRIAKTKVREGIAQGVIAFAQSFGHWWSGAQTYDVGKVSLRGSAKRGAGVQLNPVMAVGGGTTIRRTRGRKRLLQPYPRQTREARKHTPTNNVGVALATTIEDSSSSR